MKKSTLVVVLLSLSLLAQAGNILKNSDFSKVDADGRPDAWTLFKGNGKIEKGGKNFPTVFSISTSPQGKSFKATLYQKLSNVTKGEYILSGYVGGDIYALWLVVESGANPTRQWLDKNKFEKSEYEGWYRFTLKISVGTDAEKGGLFIEPFTPADAQTVRFADIKLDLQQD